MPSKISPRINLENGSQTRECPREFGRPSHQPEPDTDPEEGPVQNPAAPRSVRIGTPTRRSKRPHALGSDRRGWPTLAGDPLLDRATTGEASEVPPTGRPLSAAYLGANAETWPSARRAWIDETPWPLPRDPMIGGTAPLPVSVVRGRRAAHGRKRHDATLQ